MGQFGNLDFGNRRLFTLSADFLHPSLDHRILNHAGEHTHMVRKTCPGLLACRMQPVALAPARRTQNSHLTSFCLRDIPVHFASERFHFCLRTAICTRGQVKIPVMGRCLSVAELRTNVQLHSNQQSMDERTSTVSRPLKPASRKQCWFHQQTLLAEISLQKRFTDTQASPVIELEDIPDTKFQEFDTAALARWQSQVSTWG